MTNTAKNQLRRQQKANVSAELLFPMPGAKDARTVRLSLFADAGSVWDGKTYDDNSSSATGGRVQNIYGASNTHKSTFTNELRYSAGGAVTWLSPLGPMKFSYAYPLKKNRKTKSNASNSNSARRSNPANAV